MKCFFVILLCSLLLPKIMFSTFGDHIEKEEYQAWVIFKKNDDELYVAKEYRYNNDPIFFAYIPRTTEILDATTAETIWDALDQQYEDHLRKIHEAVQ
jgi:hypothetical protein